MSQVEYFPFQGGLDLITPPLVVDPGACIVATNYEIDIYGGYRRIAGYERYDGQPSPTDVGAGDPAAIEAQRALIQPVPGSGPIRGVWVYNGTVYAFRDDVAGSTCVMHKATPTGWQAVTTPTLLPGGRYEFVNYNFRGSAGSVMMYGCDGVNPAFQFDGTTFTQIFTGMTNDTPNHIAAHKNHLFLSFPGGSIQHSAVGDPLTWTPITGASEIGVGDECTGFEQQSGDALAIFTRNHTYMLYGTSSANWNLAPFSRTTGAIPWTNQRLGVITYYVDDRGITSLQATQAFGDFIADSISQKINPMFQAMKATGITASCVVRDKGQYRVFDAVGNVLIASFSGNQLSGWMHAKFPDPVECVANGENVNGDEVIYFGSSNGFVYQMEKGMSFDGVPIEAFLRLPFNNIRSPRTRKRFRRALIETEGAANEFELTYQVDFDDGGYMVASQSPVSLMMSSGKTYWGSAAWNAFTWSGDIPSALIADVSGTAKNLSIFIYSKMTYGAPYKLTGALIHYDVRRTERGL